MEKRHKKLSLSLLFVLLILNLLTNSLDSQAKLPITIYENKKSTSLGSGVKHEHIERYTSQGWMNINVIRVDMKNEHNQLKGLFNKTAIPNRDTVSNMVDKSGALAGINGDYFNYSPMPSAMGTLISEGKVISSPIERAYALPTFYLNTKNEALVGYLDRHITVSNLRNNKKVLVNTLNKVTPNFDTPTVLDSNWGSKSIGNRFHKDLIELVVENDRVIDLRIGRPATRIPKNGFVLAGRGVRGQAIKNFKVGDKVKLDINTSPDLDKIDFAIGGGSIILENGLPKLTDIHSAGLHPRTGIGANKDNTELILVTVDGRHPKYKGIGQKDFGALLGDLGAYNAVNLDGGGSTTMAVKYPDQNKSKVTNKPSDGSERKVVNGVGIFTNAPRGVLEDIEAICSEPSMHVNTSRNITVNGFDGHRQAVKIDRSEVQYSVEGVEGDFIANQFIPKSSGLAKITAEYKGHKSTTTIQVYDEVISLKVENLKNDTINIKGNQEYRMPNIYGEDGHGNSARLYPKDFTLSLTDNIGSTGDKSFTTNSNPSNGYLTIGSGQAIKNIKLLANPSEPMPDVELPETTIFQDKYKLDEESEDNPFIIITNYNKNFAPQLNLIMQNYLNRAEMLISVNGYRKNLLNGLNNKKGILDSSRAYDAYISGNTYISFLNTKNKGISKSDISQWKRLREDIKNASQKNIILTSQTAPWGSNGFSSKDEADILHKTLLEIKNTGKNIYFVHEGKNNKYEIKDGIRYFEINSKAIKVDEDVDNMEILEFYRVEDNLHYRFNPIFK